MIPEKDNKRNVTLKVFDLISLFAPVYISVTKSVLPSKASFSANTIYQKESAMSSPDSLTNLAKTLDSNKEAGNDTFIFN